MIKISVIIPVYNVEKYIEKCINSVIYQSYSNLEIIIVDDGSIDHSGIMCDEYSKLDERIKVIHKPNGGLSSARNVGINESCGEYLSFIDSDDWIEIDMLQKLIDACITNASDIAMCGRFRVVEDEVTDDNTQSSVVVWNKNEAIERLLTWTNIDHSVCDKIFRKELFNNLRFPENRYYEDMFVTCKLLYRANNVVHIGESKYYYLNRIDSITHEEFSPKRFDYYYACLEISNFIEKELPELKEKSDSLVNEGILMCLFSMKSIKDRRNHREDFKMILNVSRKHFVCIIQDKNVKMIKKFVFILICVNMYPPIKEIQLYLRSFAK